MTTMTRAAAVAFGFVGAACSADHRDAPDAAMCPSVATIQGSGRDARGNTHMVDLSNATVAYFMGELTLRDPSGTQFSDPGFHLGTHCTGTSPCQPTQPGSYGVGWSVCWETFPCHALSSGQGEFLKFDRLDGSCVAGSFHLVGGASSAVPGDFTGTFSLQP